MGTKIQTFFRSLAPCIHQQERSKKAFEISTQISWAGHMSHRFFFCFFCWFVFIYYIVLFIHGWRNYHSKRFNGEIRKVAIHTSSSHPATTLPNLPIHYQSLLTQSTSMAKHTASTYYHIQYHTIIHSYHHYIWFVLTFILTLKPYLLKHSIYK